MITLNIWKHANKGVLRSGNTYLGPFFSSMAGGHAGHLNLEFETFDTATNLHQLRTSHPRLPLKAISSYRAEKIASSETKETQYKRSNKKITGVAVTHSFWPETKPTHLQNLLGMMQVSDGVPGIFRNHLEDMRHEADDEKPIKHQITKIADSDFQDPTQALKALIKHDNELIIRIKLDMLAIESEINNLMKELSLLAAKRMNRTTDKNSAKPAQDTMVQEFALENQQQALEKLKAKLADTKTMLASVEFRLSLSQFEINNIYETEGKHPDWSISLPTKDSNKKYYIEDADLLKEMEKQRDNAKYTFFANNCATSVKKCILAGITQELKNALLDAGVDNSFFNIRTLEAPMSVMKWARKLNQYIEQLNLRYENNNNRSGLYL